MDQAFWNPAAETFFGYTRHEAIGQNLHSLLAPERFREAYTQALPEFQRFGTCRVIGKNIELVALSKDGQEVPISLSLSALLLDDNWHAVGIVRDITKRKQAEQALLQAKEQAESANQVKSEFLANMSHEIRTPINGIMGMMQLLEISDLNQEQKQYVDLSISSTKRLTRLLSDILDLSRVEAGKMTIYETAFVVQELGDKEIGR